MKTAIQFSGGKDSLCVVHLFRGQPDVMVYFADTGATFPHMISFIHEACALYELPLTIVKPPVSVLTHTEINGFPADIVPTDNLPELSFLFKQHGQKLQPSLRCCNSMIFEPLTRKMKEDGTQVIVRGTRWADPRVGAKPGEALDGMTIVQPIWWWSDQEVYKYLEDNNVQLPVQYSEGCMHSLDCWICTAHLAYGGQERVEFTKKNNPVLYKLLRHRLDRVRDVVNTQLEKVQGVLNG